MTNQLRHYFLAFLLATLALIFAVTGGVVVPVYTVFMFRWMHVPLLRILPFTVPVAAVFLVLSWYCGRTGIRQMRRQHKPLTA